MFTRNQIISLDDCSGFSLALGIVKEIDTKQKTLEIITPRPRPRVEEIDSIRVGGLTLDPGTYDEQWL